MENASKALIIAGAILIAMLLVSIGIMLINSGRSLTATTTSNLDSQKIQTFNSQFTPFEGSKTGAEVKSLINKVKASNAVDSEHQVVVIGTTKTGYSSQSISSINDIKSTELYGIEINYAGNDGNYAGVGPGGSTLAGTKNSHTEKGYICTMIVYKI